MHGYYAAEYYEPYSYNYNYNYTFDYGYDSSYYLNYASDSVYAGGNYSNLTEVDYHASQVQGKQYELIYLLKQIHIWARFKNF